MSTTRRRLVLASLLLTVAPLSAGASTMPLSQMPVARAPTSVSRDGVGHVIALRGAGHPPATDSLRLAPRDRAEPQPYSGLTTCFATPPGPQVVHCGSLGDRGDTPSLLQIREFSRRRLHQRSLTDDDLVDPGTVPEPRAATLLALAALTLALRRRR